MSAWDSLVAAGLVAEHAVLAPLTTYKLGGPARWYLEASDEEALRRAGIALSEEPVPVLVLGRGSNVVIADAGFDGLVVRLGTDFSWIRFEDEGNVAAGGATAVPGLARVAAREGRGGLEFLAGIPGSVGGAVRMNAGCHGSDTADWLLHARIVDLADGALSERSPEALGLRYRHSELGALEVVTAAHFRTVPVEREEGERRIREITRWRRQHQPGGTLNAGSVFKNPPGDAAGRIIDAMGLKGYRVGGASVSEKHANFFVAHSEATAQDVYDLVWAVRKRVGEETGVWLDPEVQFAGGFRPSPEEGER